MFTVNGSILVRAASGAVVSAGSFVPAPEALWGEGHEFRVIGFRVPSGDRWPQVRLEVRCIGSRGSSVLYQDPEDYGLGWSPLSNPLDVGDCLHFYGGSAPIVAYC